MIDSELTFCSTSRTVMVVLVYKGKKVYKEIRGSSSYLIRHVFSGGEGFRAGRAALLLPGLARRVGELALQLKDLVLELLDVIDGIRQG